MGRLKQILAGLGVGCVFLAASGSMSVASDKMEGIMVEQCRIRLIPAKDPRAAGYLTIHNHGATERVLISITSEIAEEVEMHNTVMEGEMARMERQERIAIPAHGSVTMKSGGYHLMFKKINPQVKFGDSATLVLHFQDGEKVETQAKVVSVREDVEKPHEHKGH